MYEVQRNGKTILEADACGIGFLASRKGVPERKLVETALQLVCCFDHRGAPGHGAGLQLDIPWPLLLDRFSAHARVIAQRDAALGMFFLPFESELRRHCVEVVERLSNVAGAEILQWADVPICPQALPPKSSALRTLPVVRQALFRRPVGLSETGWFTCRYFLRLALEHELADVARDQFSIASLSNRTVVYKGLSELSRISDLYPDLDSPDFASRYVLFHSRYCTNTTTAWRRAQPFWSIAHNGEISTIGGNRAWMKAIGGDLINMLADQHPSLRPIASHVQSIVCPGGSDTANLDDMMIALLAGGMSLPQSILALLPGSEKVLSEDSPMRDFYRASSVYFGACDGPAAIVACDGDHAVAHLDRNGLRPLWLTTTKDYVFAASELTGTVDLGEVETQKLLGPGEIVAVSLSNGAVLNEEQVHEEVARKPFPTPNKRMITGGSVSTYEEWEPGNLLQQQIAAGMTKEDLDVLIRALADTGKPALGSMGDDTSPSAMLDHLPRRLEDHFSLRFAQETSPPIDPIRDAWVFDTNVSLGDRRGAWTKTTGPLYRFPSPVLSEQQRQWLLAQPRVQTVWLTAPSTSNTETEIERIVQTALASEASVLILTDRYPAEHQVTLQPLRVLSQVHRALVKAGIRQRLSLVADVAIWDIQHCALLTTLGADAVCPWLGIASVGEKYENYLKGLRGGLTETMSMMGVTPSTAYCGAGLIESVGLDPAWVEAEFHVPHHLGGIGVETIEKEWRSFHDRAFGTEVRGLVDAGEFRHSKDGRPHANNAEVVRALHLASGYTKKQHAAEPGSKEAYRLYSELVSSRSPVSILDLIDLRKGDPIAIDEVESISSIAWRFMAPGMSEGALSGPAHRAVAHGMNVLARYCKMFGEGRKMEGIGPIANSGEGGFDKSRVGTREFNRSVQYAGGRFTITPATAANAAEAEVKFAQGAKPGKGGQLPGKKVSRKVAHQRGCEPGFELVSPPINHNLYSIEDVKLMLESWRHLNPEVNCALKYVATYGVEMVAVGGVHAGANRLHLSDGCGGTGAAKRVDQKHAGVPLAAVLPTVQDLLVEENIRNLVELSVDGGVQNGEQALKLFLFGADRVGFGTSLLISIGCSMLRKCHLSGADPTDPTGKRRLGCTPGVATQDPQWIARFAGNWKHVARTLLFVAEEVRERMAENGIRTLQPFIGRRDLLVRKPNLQGKAALLDLGTITRAPHGSYGAPKYKQQTEEHAPKYREQEVSAAVAALTGVSDVIKERLTNSDRCVGVGAAGVIARQNGDVGLQSSTLTFVNEGAAGHYYAAYSLPGMSFTCTGVVADSCFTASYGGELVLLPNDGREGLALVGNTFAYGARNGRAFIAGRAGNRFGICLRRDHEGGSPTLVVEGVEANAFQYMTGGTCLVLGSAGHNLGSGLTGGTLYLLDHDPKILNDEYVEAKLLDDQDSIFVKDLLEEHLSKTNSKLAKRLLENFDPARFVKVQTCRIPEAFE